MSTGERDAGMTLGDDEISGRAARLKEAFPGAYHEDGALVTFDMAEVARRIGFHPPVTTRVGLEFRRLGSDIWVVMPVQHGNILGSLDWRVSQEEWDAAVAALDATRESR